MANRLPWPCPGSLFLSDHSGLVAAVPAALQLEARAAACRKWGDAARLKEAKAAAMARQHELNERADRRREEEKQQRQEEVELRWAGNKGCCPSAHGSGRLTEGGATPWCRLLESRLPMHTMRSSWELRDWVEYGFMYGGALDGIIAELVEQQRLKGEREEQAHQRVERTRLLNDRWASA